MKKLRRKTPQRDDRQKISSFLGHNFSLMAENLECGFEAISRTDTCEEIFLNRFTEDDIFAILETIRLSSALKERGFQRLLLDISRDEGGRHHLSIFYDRIKHDNMLINLRLSENVYIPEIRLPLLMKKRNYSMINVEWAQAVNPKAKFAAKKPQLPGQGKPGLGVLSYLFALMKELGRQMSRDGFMEVPDHFHLAAMYAPAFRFFDPEKEALLRGVLRDLEGTGIRDISWGFITGSITEKKKDLTVEYVPGTQVHPLAGDLVSYFDSPWYRKKISRHLKEKRYRLDRGTMEKRREEILASKDHEEV